MGGGETESTAGSCSTTLCPGPEISASSESWAMLSVEVAWSCAVLRREYE